MDSGIQWWVWLGAGMAVGLAAGLGEGMLVGVLTGIAILCAPVIIFMKAGATIMPFALFFGGLAVVASFLFRRKNAREHAKLMGDIADRKRRHGR